MTELERLRTAITFWKLVRFPETPPRDEGRRRYLKAALDLAESTLYAIATEPTKETTMDYDAEFTRIKKRLDQLESVAPSAPPPGFAAAPKAALDLAALTTRVDEIEMRVDDLEDAAEDEPETAQPDGTQPAT